MKVRYSPMVSEASGSAGPIVASRWKGIDYFRERITPANPKSDLQVAQRLRLTKSVAYWHDLEQQVVDNIKTLAVGRPMSAFNLFGQRAILDQKLALALRVMPLMAPTNPLTDLVLSTGASGTLINATWSKAETGATDKIYVLAGEAPETGAYPANFFLQEKDTTLSSAETVSLTMPKAGQNYLVMLLNEVVADHEFSIAAADWATSYE